MTEPQSAGGGGCGSAGGCGGCGQMTDKKALEQNQFVFPCCNHHDRVDASIRLKQLFDKFSREAGKEQYLIPYLIPLVYRFSFVHLN